MPLLQLFKKSDRRAAQSSEDRKSTQDLGSFYKSGEKRWFKDKDFPASSVSLDGKAKRNQDGVVWRRPWELVQNPVFVDDDLSHHDVDQGALGDCWFMAGAAVLASTERDLFKRVVPLDQGFNPSQYQGKFRFNFWRYGKWTEIEVDDYLPTKGGTLVYCRNNERPNEFWPSLLEKAYAKLYGSYKALEGGLVQDALVDLTGGISEVIDISNIGNINLNSVYSLLRKSYMMKSLMGAAIFSTNSCSSQVMNGLVKGHAYSITGFEQLPGVQLIRLRNPWGEGEWQGQWSDSDPNLASLRKLHNGQNILQKDDGEFWMSFDDFCRRFDQVQICHLHLDAYTQELAQNETKQFWKETVFHDAWVKGKTAAGNRSSTRFWLNPQFTIQFASPDKSTPHSGICTIIVSLMEKDKKNPDVNIAIAFDIYKYTRPGPCLTTITEANRSDFVLVVQSDYQRPREVTRRVELPPGCYVIIPSTSREEDQAQFLLRLFTEQQIYTQILRGAMAS